MNVDFLHNQIIRDTVSPAFIESFNENLLPALTLKYGDSLECVQFYEDHLKDGLRIGGIFYYPLTVVISGTARTEWISWQVSNYRLYDNFNPFTYKGQEYLAFSFAENLPEQALSVVFGKPIYSSLNTLPLIMSAATDDKTFLAGKYAQGFIDLLSASLTELIENELAIMGLAGSGVVLEMCFAPGTYMEHIIGNTTYRRLRIKARACSARDLWVKWTRLDGNGTYTISDNVDRSMIRFELAEDVPGKIKEKEYRYLTSESVERYQQSMSRKNITEWREMMRRVIRRGEVEKYEKITISKPEWNTEKEEPVAPAREAVAEPLVSVAEEVSSLKISASAERERDEITERLNALLGKSDVEFSREPEALAESINSDLGELLRGALGISEEPAKETSEEESLEAEETEAVEDTEELEAQEATEADEIAEETEENEEAEEAEEPEEEIAEEPQPSEEEPERITTLEEALKAIEDGEALEALEKSEEKAEPETQAFAAPVIDESELEARIRRELEEKMRAEMDELRRKNEEAEALRAKLEAQKRAEAREKELLAEAARQAVLDSEKREADRRAEAERDRIEAERKAEEARRAAEELRRAEEAKAEQARIDAERAKAEKAAAAPAVQKPVYVTKTVNLIFRRGVVDKNMTKRVHEIILATIKYLGKENVYMRIKAQVPDPTTLTLTFSELPVSEQQLVVDIIQVLGKSGLGITKAMLD